MSNLERLKELIDKITMDRERENLLIREICAAILDHEKRIKVLEKSEP